MVLSPLGGSALGLPQGRSGVGVPDGWAGTQSRCLYAPSFLQKGAGFWQRLWALGAAVEKSESYSADPELAQVKCPLRPVGDWSRRAQRAPRVNP